MLKFRSRWFAVSVLLGAGFAAAMWFGSIWYGLDQFAACKNVILSSNRSPGGSRAVTVFRQECNATVPDSIWASITPADRPASPDRDHAFLGFVGSTDVQSRWRGNDIVEIAFIPNAGRFIRREAKIGGVRIDYK